MEELRKKFEQVKGYSAMAFRQDYAQGPQYEDGFCDEYVEWLESLIDKSSIEKREEIARNLLEYAEKNSNILMLESKEKTISDWLFDNQ